MQGSDSTHMFTYSIVDIDCIVLEGVRNHVAESGST